MSLSPLFLISSLSSPHSNIFKQTTDPRPITKTDLEAHYRALHAPSNSVHMLVAVSMSFLQPFLMRGDPESVDLFRPHYLPFIALRVVLASLYFTHREWFLRHQEVGIVL